MQEQTVSFFQPDEFVRKRKRGKTFHLTPAVIFPATFPNAFVKIGELVVHGLIHRYSRSEEHTSELQSRSDLVCRLLLEKKKTTSMTPRAIKTTLVPFIHS